MNQDQSETEIKVVYDVNITSFQLVEFWHPTPILRWEKHYTSIDRVNYDKVLQQMWHSNTGKQEWRDVQEED